MAEGLDERQARFQALLEQHRGIVLKVAHTYRRNDADREDLAQEICAQLWRSFGRYDEARPFSTWMYRIALNVAISRARYDGVHNPPTAPIDGEKAALIPARAAREPDERIEVLNRVIARLDPLNRALALLYLEERSYQEIADVLGLTKTNVATKISRLKERIRTELTAALPN